MNKKTFFLKALLAVAFVFLTISAALAEDINVTVKVVGKGTVSYNNKSASDGQSFTFQAALSYLDMSNYSWHPNNVDFHITYPNGYIVVVEAIITNGGSSGKEHFQSDETTFSYQMPMGATGVTLNFTFVELFRGGTESSPVILSDKSITYLAGGWYKVKNNIAFDHTIYSYGDIYLAIAKGVTMTIEADRIGLCPTKDGLKLTILDEGTLKITANDNNSAKAILDFAYEQLSGNVELISDCYGILTEYNVNIKGGKFTTNSQVVIYKDGKITISGGNVNINAKHNGLEAPLISITGGVVNVKTSSQEQNSSDILGTNLSITGGQVTAGNKGVNCYNQVILGCSSANDYIKIGKFIDSPVSIAEGQTLKDEDGNLYSGTLTSEQVAAIEGKKMTLLTAGGTLTLTQNQTGITADLQGEFAYTEEGFLTITDPVEVKKVTFKRKFSPGIPATVMFPFSFEWSNSQSIGSFYTVKSVGNEKGVWTAVMSNPITTIEANTPYIFKAADGYDESSNLTFYDVELQPTDDIKDNVNGDWTLHGVYTKTLLDNPNEINYGFAGGEADGIKVGDFIRAGKGVWADPMRCYLTYKNGSELTKAATVLPDRIRVVFPDEIEESNDDKIVTPVLDVDAQITAKVWSFNGTIFIEAQENTEYTIVDLLGRILKTGVTHSTREEISLGHNSGIAIVNIDGKSFKINL